VIMPLPRSIVAALASAAARRRRSYDGRIVVTAIGTTWRALLTSDQRGPLLTRRAETRADAYAAARALLDAAEDMVWFNGEIVGVRVERDAGG
jgi:hypothetical protein